MEAFSQQVITNNITSTPSRTQENTTFNENFLNIINSLEFDKKRLKFSKFFVSKVRNNFFDIDISSVIPSFQIIDKFSKIDEILELPNLNTFSIDFDAIVPPKNQYKIKVKLNKFKKGELDKSDFVDLI